MTVQLEEAVTVFDNDHYTLLCYPDSGILHHTFHQTTTGQMLREGLGAGVDALRQYNVTKWLSDDRKNSQVTQEDNIWAATEWGPQAAEAGWKFWALVVPEEIAGRVDMQHVVEAFYNLGVVVTVHTDPESGMEWLLKQE